MKNRRNSKKYPSLEKSVNLKYRKDFIEADYIDGVIDDKGKMVIRKLNEKEKAFLNQFYEETVNTNFSHNPKLKHLLKLKNLIIEDTTVKQLFIDISELKKELKIITAKIHPKLDDEERKVLQLKKNHLHKCIRDMNHIVKITKSQNEDIYEEKLRTIEKEIEVLRNKHLLYPNKEDHKEFYRDNNVKRTCIYNRKVTLGQLDQLNEELYDEHTSESCKNIDLEEYLISMIEKPDKEYLEEKDSVNQELDAEYVKSYFKAKKLNNQ